MNTLYRIVAGSILSAFVLAALASAPALADPVAECQEITSNQVETGQCLNDTLATTEAVMGLALQHAADKADAIDQATGRPGARSALDAAQSAWSQFRIVNCQVPLAFAAGGSGSGQFSVGCEISMTRARTVELLALASNS